MKNRRKKIIVDFRFQITFIAWMCAISFLVIAIFYFSTLIFFNKYLSQGKMAGLPDSHIFFVFLREQYRVMHLVFLVASLLAVFLSVVVGLVLSHKIVGPLLRFRSHMDAITQGKKPKEILFRKHDYFPEVVDSYNQHLKRLLIQGNRR